MVLLSHLVSLLIIFPPRTTLCNKNIQEPLYDDLVAYSHLMDIAYCISRISKIQLPFQCDNDCSDFPGTEIVQQWTSDDYTLSAFPPTLGSMTFATSGYIAINHDMKLILLALRGTRSFKDTIVDINTDMMLLNEVCTGCKVHKGFYLSFYKTWNIVEDELKRLISENKGYKVLIMGHSLGGAIGILLGMNVLEIHDDVLVVTMGQPMVGNLLFARHLNHLFGVDTECFNEQGKLIRVTHKNDPVVKLPIGDNYFIFDRYVHSSNEVFIDEEHNYGILPELGNVFLCDGAEDVHCSYGMSFTRDNTEHLDYFRTMGKCGVSLV